MKIKTTSESEFEVHFDDIKDIENLRDSLNHMIKYMKICESDETELPPLVYKYNKK